MNDGQTMIMRPWQAWLRIVLTGAVIGVLFWVVTILLTRYVVEPLTCRQLADAAQCTGAGSLGGNVAAILTALAAILVLVRMNIAQPVVIAVGAAAVLWDMAAWTTGLFWLESIAWSILLYALTYGLFAWITRYARLIPSVIVGILIIVIIRIALIL